MNHSSEPWRKGLRSDSIVCDDMRIALTPDVRNYYGGNLVCESLDEEDRERIIACVNACAGITTEKLAGKSIAEYVSEEAFLSGMTIEDGVDIGITGLACQMLASALAGQFVGSGAINYLAMNMAHPELGPFTVTIQRQQGKTPAELRREAEEKIEILKAGIEAVRALMDSSHGVAGLHLNGDVAPWDELSDGGRFEEHLLAFNQAEKVIAN